MQIIKLRQNTPEWLAWRKQGVGASDSTIITEAPVPWDDVTTPRQLWEQKTGRAEAPDSNYQQRRGSRLEPTVRELYRQKTGLEMPAICGEHDEHPWMRASLDGCEEWGELILEIKCPRIESHMEAVEGKVPAYYWSQLQHQLAVSGAKLLHYCSYSEKKDCPECDRFALVEVEPDPDYIERLMLKEWEFWGRVLLNVWPEEPAPVRGVAGETNQLVSGLYTGSARLPSMEVSR